MQEGGAAIEQIVRPRADGTLLPAGRRRAVGPFIRLERLDGAADGVGGLVALPEGRPTCLRQLRAARLPCLDGVGMRGRLLAGSLHGRHAPVEGGCGLVLAALGLADGVRFRWDAEHEERAVLVLDGAIEVPGQGLARAGRLLVFRPGGEIALSAREAAGLVLLGGAKLAGARNGGAAGGSAGHRVNGAIEFLERFGRFYSAVPDGGEGAYDAHRGR